MHKTPIYVFLLDAGMAAFVAWAALGSLDCGGGAVGNVASTSSGRGATSGAGSGDPTGGSGESGSSGENSQSGQTGSASGETSGTPMPSGSSDTGSSAGASSGSTPGGSGESGSAASGASESGATAGGDSGTGTKPDASMGPDAGSCAPNDEPLKTGNGNVDAYDCMLISLAAQYKDPDPMMVKAQIEQESGFNMFATSPDSPCGDPAGWTDAESKSFGLIQVTPACGETPAALLPNGHPNLDTDTTSTLWASSIFNPAINLEEGLRSISGSLRSLEVTYPGCTMAQYVEMSAGAFNSGNSAVTGCAAFNSRAQGYVNSVLGHYRTYATSAHWPDPY
jgi:hypothetical protein